MKKCPFCFEEIQDEAVYCRYCHRKVRGLLFLRIIILIAILVVIALAFIYRDEVKGFLRGAKSFFSDAGELLRFARERIKDLPDRIKAREEEVEILKKVLGK